MARMQLFGGTAQVPIQGSLLFGNDEETGAPVNYITISTEGPPFGPTPSIRPFTMKDADLYGVDLREVLQQDIELGWQNRLQTAESLNSLRLEVKEFAYFLEEFAAKYHQKAVVLEKAIQRLDE